VGALLVVAVAGAVAADAAQRDERPPKLVQLSYAESDDGSSARRALFAFERRADKVKFATSYDGDRALARSVYRSNITDRDLHPAARHPWALVRKNGGKQVLGLIHEALFERGFAHVRVISRGNGRRNADGVRIVLGDCAQEPPLYPVSCEVKP
jgi:hypothetical protein